MQRRSFLRAMLLGVGALYTATTTGLDLFAKKVGLKRVEPFPTWNVKWRLAGQRGWAHQSEMHLPEGVMPPAFYKRQGVDYDLFRSNALTRQAWYWRRASGPLYQEPDGKSPYYSRPKDSSALMYVAENGMFPDTEAS